MWYRVFGLNDDNVAPSALAAHLHAAKLIVEPHFKGDDLGWTEGELRLPGGSPILLARFLTEIDDLRDDLNAYAAELETMDYEPNHEMLMERVIRTKQLITLRKPLANADESAAERACESAAAFLAQHCDGLVQIDGRGWFDAAGKQLLTEY
jgi:hypothetical protein